MTHLSISQIRMFRRCEKQYYFRYLLGLKIRPPGAVTLGISVDKGVSHNFSQKIKSHQDLPLADVLDAYSTAFESLRYDTDWKDEKPDRVKDDGYSLMEVHHSQKAPTVQPIAVQKKIEIPFENVNYSFIGILDAINDKGVILDTKTTSRTPPEDQIKRDEQLTAYALLYRVEYGKEEAGIELDYLVRTKKPKLVVLEGWRTQADIDLFLEEVGKVWQAIKTGIFYRTDPTNWWCSPQWCGYWDKCQVRKNKKIYA